MKKQEPQTVTLTVEKQERLKEQILIVLADYQTTVDPWRFANQGEGVRIEVANRIMNNLRLIAN